MILLGLLLISISVMFGYMAYRFFRMFNVFDDSNVSFDHLVFKFVFTVLLTITSMLFLYGGYFVYLGVMY